MQKVDKKTPAAQNAHNEFAERDMLIGEQEDELEVHNPRARLEQAVVVHGDTMTLLLEKIATLESRSLQLQELAQQVNRLRDSLVDTEELIAAFCDGQQTTEPHKSAALAVQRVTYRRLIRRVHEAIAAIVPEDAIILVISKGDESLIALEKRHGWHFPQGADGTYPGFSPADSGSAIVQLEALRAKGADYLVFPSPAFWWLDHYSGLREYLDRRYRLLFRCDDTCIIYDLRRPNDPVSQNVWTAFADFVTEVERRCEHDPAILDWGSGLNLAARFSRRIVFSPPTATGTTSEASLPYLKNTVDVVVIATNEDAILDEARRVAQIAVVVFAGSNMGVDAASDITFTVRWLSDIRTRPRPSTSIIIPTFNGRPLLDACIRSLQENLPSDFRGEIIVIDDASADDTPERMRFLAEQDSRIKFFHNMQNLGFLGSCNRGAELARGDILVFMNNDTLPQAGWLEPLLEIFETRSDAGAVGSKLVYPDGRLQEAGGVIFSDGSGANFGRNDYELDAPLYNYVREVDYVTGALIATPRAIFERLGGFDLRYTPAYYEETDYCFRVRQLGFKVYYQPASVIIHMEGASCGTDLSSGYKRFQVVNRQKFMDRWREPLRRQPDNPHHFDKSVWYGLAVREERDATDNAALDISSMYDRDKGTHRRSDRSDAGI